MSPAGATRQHTSRVPPQRFGIRIVQIAARQPDISQHSVVEFGKMLDDTLMSTDVQKAFGALQRASDTSGNASNLLIFDLQRYTFEEFGAHISLKISLSRGGQEVFSKTYVQDGRSQGGKMFWGGVFAQKNAVQQSTKLALDEILRQLLSDLNTQAR